MANVKVRLKDASNNVLHPETDWSVVQNKPSIKLTYNDGSQDTSADSTIHAVVNLVSPGEAWDTYSNGGKSIVIGNNDNALGFCGTNSKRLFTVLQSKHNINVASNGSINMSATGNINIKSRETNNRNVSLADYPINWSALNMNNGPFKETLDLNSPDGSSHAKSSVQNAVFGIYAEISSNMIWYYPAFAIVYNIPGGRANRNVGYYLNGSGVLTEITNMVNFRGFLD